MDSQKQCAPITPSRMQLLFSLAYSMVPLLGFWGVEKYWATKSGELAGLRAGIIAAIVLALAEVAWFYVRERRWEMFAVWSALLVIVMGLVSWKLHTTVVLRLKPAIIEGIFATIFIGSSIIKKPFMLIMAKKQMGDVEFSELQLSYFNGINWRVGILFIIHTAMTIYAALELTMDGWAFVKGVLFYVLFFIYFAFEFCYSRFIFRRKMVEHLQKQQVFLAYQREIIEKMRRGSKK